jgi:hypothetical protein
MLYEVIPNRAHLWTQGCFAGSLAVHPVVSERIVAKFNNLVVSLRPTCRILVSRLRP